MRRRSMWLMGMMLLLVVGLGLGIQTVSSASPAATGWTAYVANIGDESATSSVTPISTATNTVSGAQIGVGKIPNAVAFTPDGRSAYVTNNESGLVTPIDTATGVPGAPITVQVGAVALAVTPDGQTVWVVNQAYGTLQPISVATNTAGSAFSVGSSSPSAIAIAPNGQTAYVADSFAGTVVAVNLATRSVAGTPITVGTPGHSQPAALAITPNGQTVYVVDEEADAVVPISTATNTAGTPIKVGTDPTGLAITPDGKTVYVADINGASVTPISTATNTADPAIALPGIDPAQIAITPDGRTAYVTSDETYGTVTPISLATNTPGPAISTDGKEADGIAITPDQAPTATFSLTAAAAGQESSFDGSASSSPVGSIVSYAWDFGDGQTATTTTPTTTHTYAQPGTYTARLTVTNSAGTSLTQVFTGQTVSNQGGPSASTTHAVTVAAAAAPTTTTTSPTPPPVTGVSTSGDTITVTVSVSSGVVVVTVTIVEQDGQVIKIVYVNPDVRRKIIKRQLVIGRATIRPHSGKTEKVTVKLNARGRALLAHEHRMTAALAIKVKGKVVDRVAVHLKAPKKKLTRRHRGK